MYYWYKNSFIQGLSCCVIRNNKENCSRCIGIQYYDALDIRGPLVYVLYYVTVVDRIDPQLLDIIFPMYLYFLSQIH